MGELEQIELELINREIASRQSSQSPATAMAPNFIGPESLPGIMGALSGTPPMIEPELSKQTGLGLFEGATLGLPRTMLKPAGIDIPRGNLPGQIAGFALGPGKAVGALGKAVKIPGMIGSTVAGALEGGVGGFLFPQEDFGNLKGRLAMAEGGTAFGATLGFGIGTIKSAYKAFTQIKNARNAIKQLETQKFEMRNPANIEKAEQIQEGISALKSKQAEAIKLERQAFQSQSKEISKLIKGEAENKAQMIKQPILDYMKRFKEEWGQSFDDALENAPEQGITVQDLRAMGQETIDELVEMGIDPKGPVVRTIRNQIRRFKNPVEQQPMTIQEPGPLGELINKTVMRPVEGKGVVKNLDLIKIKRNVTNSLSSNARSGQFTEQDIAGAIFNSKIADRLSSTVGDRLTELNSAYKDFKDIAEFTYKTFKPRASEYRIATGSNILKNYALGKTDAGQNKAIALLERETGIKFSKNLESMGKQLEQLKSLQPKKLEAIEGKFSAEIRALEAQKKSLKTGNRQLAYDLDKKIKSHRDLLEDMASIRKIGAGIGNMLGASFAFEALRRTQIPKKVFNAVGLGEGN